MSMNNMELDYQHDGVHAGVAEVEYGKAAGGSSNTYRVTVHYDESYDNPWEAWDTQPPLTSVCGRNFTANYGHADTPELDKLTAAQVINNHEAVDLALAPFFEYMEGEEPHSVLEMIYGNKLPFDSSPFTDPLEVIRQEIAHNYISGSMDTEMLDRLEEVWGWLGVQTWRDQVVGYSQGDWCDALLVATPEWLEKSGLKAASAAAGEASEERIHAALESAAELWGHYMFGDVYGATVERLVPNGPDDAEWEEVDSCWGFYGPDHDKSGLNEFVRDALRADGGLKEAA